MLPIGPLMIEHRLIDRMVALVKRASDLATEKSGLDPLLVDAAIDFVRVYADRTHHGKEEDILFRDLANKRLSDDDARVMRELVDEHAFGREVVRELAVANTGLRAGDRAALGRVIEKLGVLVEFYPRHIVKEDKVFFPASMQYFSPAEKDAMLAEMWEFDRKMIHDKYLRVVDELAEQLGGAAG